jgi:N-acetylneuraminic acid mutarotase
VTTMNGILYAIGGSRASVGAVGDTDDVAAVEGYDPTSNTWTTRASMPTPRGSFGVTSINGIAYVAGGISSAGLGNVSYLATVIAYDPSSNMWTTKTSMPTAQWELAASAINGLLYAVGGYNNQGGYVDWASMYLP